MNEKRTRGHQHMDMKEQTFDMQSKHTNENNRQIAWQGLFLKQRIARTTLAKTSRQQRQEEDSFIALFWQHR